MTIFIGLNRMLSSQRVMRELLTILLSFLILLITGCGATKPVTQYAPNPEINRLNFVNETKNIFIFFDGTANDWTSRTNIRRLFELVAVQENPKQLSIYIDGVGSSSTPLTGGIFGYGMKPRIMEGYMFLARHYSPGDKVYIFGFSRGAHQARALAGMLSYNGIPKYVKSRDKKSQKNALKMLKTQSKNIWNLSKDQNDNSDEQWRTWESGSPAPFAKAIKESYDIDTISVKIDFLGIWDTVPGSSFKKYSLYKECEDNKDGDRYKIQPYPTIGEIVHAVSLDEKRTKFRPVLVRKPIDITRTQLHQAWFPGAHADVGGGYEDSNDLAGLSLNWMLGFLYKYDIFEGQRPTVYSATNGLAHWSIGDRPANLGSKEEDRVMPEGAILHPSIQKRKMEKKVPVRKNNQVVFEKYNGLYWDSQSQYNICLD